MPEFKLAKCPSCGGSLQVPEDRARVKCMYCGNDIVVKEAVAAAVVGVNLEALKELARTAAAGADHAGARKYWTRVLELDPKNHEAWFGLGKAERFSVGIGAVRIVADTRFAAAIRARLSERANG